MRDWDPHVGDLVILSIEDVNQYRKYRVVPNRIECIVLEEPRWSALGEYKVCRLDTGTILTRIRRRSLDKIQTLTVDELLTHPLETIRQLGKELQENLSDDN